MLSRSEFESAGQAFAHRHSSWSWVPAQRPGYGYLTRSTAHFMTPSNSEEDQLIFDQPEEDDNATADAQPSRQALSVQEYIVYSASFNVPAFYFTMHNTSVFLQSLFNSAHLTPRRWRTALPRWHPANFHLQVETPLRVGDDQLCAHLAVCLFSIALAGRSPNPRHPLLVLSSL